MPVIQPEIIVTPDMPTVRFREPKDQVELDKQLPAILHAQGWGCGTYLHIQFLNHEKTQLLADGLFVVTNEMSSLKTTGSAHSPNTKEVISRRVEQVGDWRFFNDYSEPTEEVTSSTGKATLRWNPGKKVHEVIVDGEVVYENADKTEVIKERDKLNELKAA